MPGSVSPDTDSVSRTSHLRESNMVCITLAVVKSAFPVLLVLTAFWTVLVLGQEEDLIIGTNNKDNSRIHTTSTLVPELEILTGENTMISKEISEPPSVPFISSNPQIESNVTEAPDESTFPQSVSEIKIEPPALTAKPSFVSDEVKSTWEASKDGNQFLHNASGTESPVFTTYSIKNSNNNLSEELTQQSSSTNSFTDERVHSSATRSTTSVFTVTQNPIKIANGTDKFSITVHSSVTNETEEEEQEDGLINRDNLFTDLSTTGTKKLEAVATTEIRELSDSTQQEVVSEGTNKNSSPSEPNFNHYSLADFNTDVPGGLNNEESEVKTTQTEVIGKKIYTESAQDAITQATEEISFQLSTAGNIPTQSVGLPNNNVKDSSSTKSNAQQLTIETTQYEFTGSSERVTPHDAFSADASPTHEKSTVATFTTSVQTLTENILNKFTLDVLTSSTSTTETPPIISTQNPDQLGSYRPQYKCKRPGRFPARPSCTEFHICQRVGFWLVHITQTCRYGLEFSSRYGQCVPSRLSDCSPPSIDANKADSENITVKKDDSGSSESESEESVEEEYSNSNESNEKSRRKSLLNFLQEKRKFI